MFLTSRRTPPPFLPAQAQREPSEALQPVPAGSPRTEAERRLGEALLRIVLHASRRVEIKQTGAVVRAVPEHLIDAASELLAELGM